VQPVTGAPRVVGKPRVASRLQGDAGKTHLAIALTDHSVSISSMWVLSARASIELVGLVRKSRDVFLDIFFALE
jgi:hypothetical protein